MLAPWKKSFNKPRQHTQKQRPPFADKGQYSQNYGFSNSHGCEIWTVKKNWELKNWCFGTVVLENTYDSPLDSKEIKPVNPKGNQPWIFIGRTDTEAKAPILWPPDGKSRLIGKDSDAGKDWGQEEKGATEGESLSKLQEIVKDREGGMLQFMGSQRVGYNLATEQG